MPSFISSVSLRNLPCQFQKSFNVSVTTKSVTVFPVGGVTVIVHSAVLSSEFDVPDFWTIFSDGSDGPLGLLTVTDVSPVDVLSSSALFVSLSPPSGTLLISSVSSVWYTILYTPPKSVQLSGKVYSKDVASPSKLP